jgi:hypothetical protein
MKHEHEEESDNEFEDRHHCTDFPCCIAFAVAVACLGFLFQYGASNGNVPKLIAGFDSQGQQCGIDAAVEYEPYLFYCPAASWTSLSDVSIDSSNAVCVKECPTAAASTVSCATGNKGYPTTPFMGHYCIPDAAVSGAKDTVEKQVKLYAHVAQGFEEVKANWRTLLLVFVAAVVLGYLYLFLLKLFASCLIYICVAISMITFIGGGAYLFFNADSIGSSMEHPLGDNTTPAIQAVAAVLVVLGLVVGCLACCCGNSMEISIACIESGTEVMWENPSLLLSPLIKAVVKVGFALVLFGGFMQLWSTANVTPGVVHRQFEFTQTQWGYIIFYILVSYWILEFITALYQFSIAFCVAEYYFTPPEPGGDDTDRDTGHFSAVQGCFIGLQKHAGSLAFGALIVAILETIQKILQYLEKQNEEHGGNPVIKCVMCCFLCCFKCCEEMMRAVNKMAYIDIAILSDTFCGAVMNVMKIFVSYGAAMAILNGATLVFQIVGSCMIVAACGALAEIMLTNGAFNELSITLLVACILAGLVSWSFMTVFDMTTDTLLYCFAVDKEQNGHATTAPEAMRPLFEEAEHNSKGDEDTYRH